MGAAKIKRGDALIRRYADEAVRVAVSKIPGGSRVVPVDLNPLTKETPYRHVRNWMRLHADEYDTATQLAESAIAEFDLPEPGVDARIWDDAVDAKLEDTRPFDLRR